MNNTQNNQDAVNAFVAEINQAIIMANRLTEYLADHFEVGPDDIHWAHVGDASRIRVALEQILHDQSLKVELYSIGAISK